MVYAPHVRVSFGGGLGGETTHPESWSCTLNYTTSDDEAFVAAGHAIEVNLAAQTLIHAAAAFGSTVHQQWAKVSAIDAMGHVVGPVDLDEGTGVAGVGTILLPFQCSLVVSLRTGQRGPSKRGRFYLPPPNVHTDANGEITESARNAYEELVQDFLQTLDTEFGGGGSDPVQLVVASSKGYNTPVTGFNMGRVVDTQRRRRRSLTEAYGDLIPL